MPSSFAPYVPAFQLRRLSTRTAPPTSASEEHGEGASLLVDVAGFTSLTDRFATRGGMIRFVSDRSRIRLRINLEATRAADLTLSSKLLRPAQIVPTGKD